MATQQCSTDGCDQPAAFQSRTKPAWCLGCIDARLLDRGLRPLEDFTKPKQWRLCACVKCEVKAHYQFDTAGSGTCTACEAMRRAEGLLEAEHRSLDRNLMTLLRTMTPEQVLTHVDTPRVRKFLESVYWPSERIARRLDELDFEFVQNLAQVNDGNFPVVAKCRTCGTVRATRLDYLTFGCVPCRSTRTSNPKSPRQSAGIAMFDAKPDLRMWWDRERNDNASIPAITARATRMCNWRCPDCDHHFTERVSTMVSRTACPECVERAWAERRIEAQQWEGFVVADVPPLAAAWADDADPRTVAVGGRTILYRFRCQNDHFPRVSIGTFLANGCAHCRAARTAKDRRFIAEMQPELASQWHPTLNGQRTPSNVGCDSSRQIWWLADCCGHSWRMSPRDRDTRARWRCPECRTILDSLAWQKPELAKEWSPANPLTAWQVRPNSTLPYEPEWICSTDNTHVWVAPLNSRSTGTWCPECRPTGKSAPEIAYRDAALRVFGNARSNLSVRDARFSATRPWSTDILVELGGHNLVIEYDGAYWHDAPDKRAVDERKTQDLLAAGYPVVRLREYPLALLAIEHPMLRQIRVYPSTSRTDEVMHEIADWARSVGGPPLP